MPYTMDPVTWETVLDLVRRNGDLRAGAGEPLEMSSQALDRNTNPGLQF
jgi:hypothetical protein